MVISFEEFNNLKKVIKNLSGSVSVVRRLVYSSDKSNGFDVYDEEQCSYQWIELAAGVTTSANLLVGVGTALEEMKPSWTFRLSNLKLRTTTPRW